MYSLLPIVFRKNGNNGLFEILKKKKNKNKKKNKIIFLQFKNQNTKLGLWLQFATKLFLKI
jgi:hypothetical protein